MNLNVVDDTDAQAAGDIVLSSLLPPLQGRAPAESLLTLIEAGADQLPMPGRGQTMLRWRMLAEVAAHDLGLAKLYEGHTDALAILGELGAGAPLTGQSWGVWCAEPPGRLLQAVPSAAEAAGSAGTAVRLSGSKPWCSGAAAVDQALVSGWLPDGQPCLIAVAMAQPGVRIQLARWQAVGMAGSASFDVAFDDAAGVLVGAPGEYLGRPGFIHGGAGVAACWYGAATQIAGALQQAAVQREDAHRLAHLGALDVTLASAASLLRVAA